MRLAPKVTLRFAGCLLVLCSAAEAGTIYLCRAYSGGEFWSSAHCSQKQSLFLRSFGVPDGIPFDQQVELGRQGLASIQRHRADNDRQSFSSSSTTQSTTRSTTTYQASSECPQLDKTIRNLDAMARQPLSGARQDQIRAARSTTRSRQVQLDCPQPAVE